ncbi:hypothetical protein NKR19_g7532 [Coniochaeta hoffmannii]|uniref:Multiple myeloma tumor-associated protein 2-like N-terminal domain-containing protein n=1 Tax=Coniochaeta hoffmannii TaxID=91930 RepID=A0AA38RA76_9PEZI|nr:hypothetical protein NKR19_g7532 [Coniochaeta hoffmannii]
MDLLSTVRKQGSRGGVNFSWDEVATSAHRENYLGHSLKAPVGRWAQGRDLTWYAKADSKGTDLNETEDERKARERREEIKRIKEAEEDAIAKALGLPPKERNLTGANAIESKKRTNGKSTQIANTEIRRGIEEGREAGAVTEDMRGGIAGTGARRETRDGTDQDRGDIEMIEMIETGMCGGGGITGETAKP